MKKKRKNNQRKNSEKRNELLRELILFIFMTLFSLSYFYLDPQITGLTILNETNSTEAIFGIQPININNLTEIIPIENITNNTSIKNKEITFNSQEDSIFRIQIANVLNLSLIYPFNASIIYNNSATLNVTQEGNITNFIIYGGNTSNLDYNNILYKNTSITGVQANNITYNFTALPIKPDGTDGLVLLYHFDNASSLENDTHTLDYSNQVKALNNGTYIRWNTTQQSLGNLSGRFGNSFMFNGMNNFVNVNNSASLQIVQNITLSAWIKFDYQFTNYSSTYSNISSQGVIDKGDYGLYFDIGTGTLNFKLDNKSAVENWTISRGGNSNITFALKEYNGVFYAGKGKSEGEGIAYWCNHSFNTSGDIQVCDPDEWFESYNNFTMGTSSVNVFEVFNGKLYAGLGAGSGDGDIIICNANNTGNASVCDGNADWKIIFNNTITNIASLKVFNGMLYAGFAGGTGQGDIWICKPNMTGDDKLCDLGDWKRSYNSAESTASAFEVYNNRLYSTAFGGGNNLHVCDPELNTTNLGEGLRECDPDEWNSSVFDTGQEELRGIKEFNGRLYVGQGTGSGEGDVLVCNPVTNTTGDRTTCDSNEWNISFDADSDSVYVLEAFNGKLYAGTGGNSLGEGDIYVCDPSRNSTGGNLTVCDVDEWTPSYQGRILYTWALGLFNNRLYSGGGEGDFNVTGNILVLGYNNT
ncbi:hypothetical protein HYX16_00005, partial [Candidatus Woesearchaeota archaeon]|nr:hypothetical protein [Candidatus Woesearchaeota archaeon]